MEAKPARLSRTVLTEIILPADTNYHNTVFGGRVMQYIDKHDDIETLVRERYRRAIEACYRDLRLLANQDIDTANLSVTPALQDQAGQQAVAASHIQDAPIARDQL